MDWPTELLKHLTSSKSLVIASLITSVTLLFGGGILFPAEISPKGNLRLVLVSVAVFSTVLVLIVLCEKLYKILREKTKKMMMAWRGRNLTGEELSVIEGMASNTDGEIDISRMASRNSEYKKIEILHIINSLRSKGYIEEIFMCEDIASLSSKGRKKGLEIIRSKKK